MKDYYLKNEQFSGADDYTDLNADGFDDLGADGFEEQSQAQGGILVEKSQSAYKVNIAIDGNASSYTSGDTNIVIFGRDKYLLVKNFGNSGHVSLSTGFADTSYAELLEQSAVSPMIVSSIRMKTDTAAVFDYAFSLISKDANGQQLNIPVDPMNYYSPLQIDAGIIDIPYKFQIDSNNFITLSLPYSVVHGNTINISMTFFPHNTARLSRILTSERPIKTNPRPVTPTMFNRLPANPFLRG